MLGNEAIARGAYEAGVKVTSAYPGTPSTEVSENVVKYEVFMQNGLQMKRLLPKWLSVHLCRNPFYDNDEDGCLNVAADPLYSGSYME